MAEAKDAPFPALAEALKKNQSVEVVDERQKVLNLTIGSIANIEGIKFRVERVHTKKKRVILRAVEKITIRVTQ